jgi:hypothetical protein
MYIVNTSFMVEYAVHARWLDTMTRHFLPLVASAGFPDIVFTRVLSDESEGHFTYSLQIPVSDMTGYRRFVHDLLSEYIAVADPAFGEQVLHFTSLLKRVEWGEE